MTSKQREQRRREQFKALALAVTCQQRRIAALLEQLRAKDELLEYAIEEGLHVN